MQLLFYATHFIYKTTNLVNGKIYIGQHKTTYKVNTYLGSGTLFKRAIKKYGRDSFKREIIEYCTEDFVDEREKYWINYYDSKNNSIGYNLVDGGGGTGGLPLTEYQKEALIKANTGRKMSEELKLKLISIHKNRVHTEEERKKQSEARIGKKHSEETKEKIRIKNSGKTHPQFGKHQSEEHKNNIRLGNLGKKQTEESKQKMKNVYKFISPEGIETTIIGRDYEFMKKHNIGYKIWSLSNTGIKHKGWELKIIPKEDFFK